MRRYHLLLRLAAAAALAVCCASALAQSRPIRLIVPYAASSPIDSAARILADAVKDMLGTIVVENKAGAGSNIDADVVARSISTSTTSQ